MAVRMPLIAFLCSFSLLISFASAEETEADYYVAPGGDDANPGTRQKPFATIARARDAVRVLNKAGLKKSLKVFIRGGTFRLTEPLVFGPEDSGTKPHSITYAAFPGEMPVLNGGRRITGWKKGNGGVWEVTIPEVKAGNWAFRELFVNNSRRTRARSPNQGYSRIEKSGADRRTNFVFRKGDLKVYENLGEAEVVFFHDWCTSRVLIKSVEPDKRVVRFTGAIGSGVGNKRSWGKIDHFEKHPRYYVENVRELLDAPGEWHLAVKEGVLRYVPLPGELLSKVTFTAPVAERLLEVRGKAGRPIRNLHFNGIAFSHCAWIPPLKFGLPFAQAAHYDTRLSGMKGAGRARVPAAIELSDCENCTIEGCRFSQLGGCGLALRHGCNQNRVIGCEFTDLAANGVMIGEGNKARGRAKDGRPVWDANPSLIVKRNAVANCLIHHCGVLFPGSVGVWVGLTEGTVISHNEIRNLPYTGVSAGWMWNTRPTPCKGNIIEFNHIHHIMQRLSDGGGIYTLGRQPGTILRGNHIHGIPPQAGRAEANGMFLDEGTSEILIVENTIHGVTRSPLRFHKATRNTIRKNTLAVTAGSPPYRFNACSADTMKFEGDTVIMVKGDKGSVRTSENGRVGSALVCSGIGSHMDVPHAPGLDPKSLTVEAWIRLGAVSSSADSRVWVVNKNGNEWEDGHYALVVNGSRAMAYLNIGGEKENCHSVIATTPLQLGKWHHLAMTYDGSNLRLYVDGIEKGSKAIGKPRRPGNTSLRIGARQDGYKTSGFRGMIDEVRIEKRALKAEEIAARHSAPEKVKKTEAVAGHWGFEAVKEADAAEYIRKALETAGLEEPWRERLDQPVKTQAKPPDR